MVGSDASILRRLRANDRTAFERVIAQQYQAVYRQLWHLCGDAETAADLTQETFVAAWQSLPTFQGRSSLRTWLYTIAVRVWRRWQGRRAGGDAVPLEELAEELPDSAPGPSVVAETQALQEEIQSALLRLPAVYREALVLYYIQGLKYSEIAIALDVPMGTVKSRLHTGLERLRGEVERPSSTEVVRCTAES
jgi:RNA polymerase sigma-70 factor (ECF subfamily)